MAVFLSNDLATSGLAERHNERPCKSGETRDGLGVPYGDATQTLNNKSNTPDKVRVIQLLIDSVGVTWQGRIF